jgi:hypothetical protein
LIAAATGAILARRVLTRASRPTVRTQPDSLDDAHQPETEDGMSRIKIFGACAMAAVAAIAVLAPSSSYASAPDPGFEGAPLAASLAPAQMASANVSPLLAKELAVLTNEGISPERAWQAIDAQGKLARADLASKLQAATGSTSGGTWFDPATAQMHVGVTAQTHRQAADQAITQAGLTAVATITPVRSTMDQLLAVQKEWNRKLAPLFARNEVTTGIEPQHNAVSVTLGSAVPAAQRAALEREAADAGVNVSVTVLASPRLNIAPAAKECEIFNEATLNARCNPSITAGVEIKRPSEFTGVGEGTSHMNTTLDGFAAETLVGVFVGDNVQGPGIKKGTLVVTKPTETSVTISQPAEKKEKAVFEFFAGSICSAGPAAIPTKQRSKRVLLTAGHCIVLGGHGTGSFWNSFKRSSAEELRLGAAGTYQYGGAAAEGKGDFAEISIEPPPGGKWQTGKVNRPVLAVTAEWKKEAETRYKVKNERAAEAGNTNCHDGRTSGEWCGKIKRINVTYGTLPFPNTFAEGMVEDEKLIAEAGDSGGPVMFIEPNNEVLMEGTMTAGPVITCKENATIKTGPEFFVTHELCLEPKERVGTGGLYERKIETFWQPLRTSPLKIPEGSLEKLKLDLLTTANERIQPEFAASKFPVKITTSSGESRLETSGGRLVKCKASKGEGEVNSATELKNILIKLTGCKGKISLGEGPCKSSGAAAEEIVTNKIKGLPVYLNKSKTEVGLLDEPQEAGALYAEFKCENIFTETIKVKGATLGALTPVNSSTTLFTLKSKQEKGKPTPSLYENAEGENVKIKGETKGEGIEAFGYEESAIEATHTITGAEAVEVEG